MKRFIFLLLTFLLLAPFAYAQDIVGDWEGTLEVQGTELPVIFHILEEDGSLKATMDSPMQGATGIPMDEVSFEGSTLKIKAASMGMNYEGKLLEKAVKGKFSQGGMGFPLELTRAQAKVEKEIKTDSAIPVTGDWYGTLETMGVELRIIFHITESADGSLNATLDSPDQKVLGIPAQEVLFEKNQLKINIPRGNFLYEGEYDAEKNELTGVLKQMGQELSLNMSREEVEEQVINRPQTPKGPFAYEVEEVTFVNVKADSIQLAGTLTKPKGKKAFPAAILISGSGPQDRNEEILQHKPFWVIADYLTSKGYAVLRYDDRGVADSEGDFKTATSVDFASDVAAAVAYLRSRKDIDASKIGMIGHSEGGIIAPMVASNDKQIAFIILLAGPGIPSIDLMPMQIEAVGLAADVPPKMAKLNAKTMDGAYKILNKGADSKEELEQKLSAYLKEAYSNYPEADIPTPENMEATVQANVRQMTTPWFQYFMKFNPNDFLRKVKCPVLAINGDKDVQVPAKVNLEGIQQSLKRGGNRKVTIHSMKNLNHLFQESETGSVMEYGKLEETFSPKVLEIMSDWLGEHVK